MLLQILTEVVEPIGQLGWLDQIKDIFTSIGGIIGVSGVTITTASAVILRTILPNNRLIHNLHNQVHTLQDRIKTLQTEREQDIKVVKNAFEEYRGNVNEILNVVVKNSPNAKVRELQEKVEKLEVIAEKTAVVVDNTKEVVKGVVETIRVLKKK